MKLASPFTLLAGLSDPARIRIGRTFATSSVVLGGAGSAMLAVFGHSDFLIKSGALNFAALALGLGALTWVMIRAQARNGAVWVMAWASLFAAAFTAGVALSVLFTRGVFPDLTYDQFRELSPATLPRPAALALHFRFWAVVPTLWLPLTLGLLLFPNGRALNRRWRWIGWWSVTAIAVATLATAVAQNPWSTEPIRTAEGTLEGSIGAVIDLSFLLAGISSIVSVASLIVRYRRSSGVTRSQIRWIAWAGAIMVFFLFLTPLLEDPGPTTLIGALIGLAIEGVLIAAYGIAIMRYRLYDIDVVISRSLTYGALAVFIGVVYVAIVVGIGELVGQGDGASFGLSVGATAVVAIGFQPARTRVQVWANRLVYGERATPYEVLARFSRRAAETSDEELLTRIPRLIVDGTGAAQAALWVGNGDGFRIASSWPEESANRHISGNGQFADPAADYSVPVFHDGELLGGVSLTKARGETVTPTEEELLTNLAGGLGLALRNTRLTDQLRHQVDDLERSRDRLVSAADEARRSLEHDLDSGPQQQLVAVKVKLGPIRKMAEQHGADKTARVLADIESQAGDAIQAVRDFAGGIYPPLLEAEGLAVALGQQARRAALPISIHAENSGRYPRDIEAAVYFTVLEALQNTAKYAQATTASITLLERNGQLHFEVQDNGTGFDQTTTTPGAGLNGMADRIDTINGTLHIQSEPGTGTTITAQVPLKQQAGV